MTFKFSGRVVDHLLLLATTVLLCACSDPFGPDTVRELGLIQPFPNHSPEITFPDTVSAKQSFKVEIATFGSRFCTEPDETEVEIAGQVAVLTPYDRTEGGTCDLALWRHEHEAVVRFEIEGTALLRVRGLGLFTDSVTSQSFEDTVIVERTVIVR